MGTQGTQKNSRRDFWLLLVVVCLALLPALACGRLPAEETTATPAPTAAPTQPATATATPEPTARPTLTPTPGPLTADLALEQVAPSLALVETPLRRGTAVLLDNGYLLTNADTVWPFTAGRVLLSDGEELLDVPVAHWDMLANLALLGPVETALPTITLGHSEQVATGSDVFLVAYPRAADDSSDPWVNEGELRGQQQWAAPDLTFFQTNAHSSADQRGGVLLSDEGEVIGIAGYYEVAAGFGLVLSAADVAARVQALLDGHELNDLSRTIPGGELTRDSYTVILDNSFDQGIYLFTEKAGTAIELETSEEEFDVGFRVLDGRGDSLMAIDQPDRGDESGAATTAVDGLHVVEVFQAEDGRSTFHLDSSVELTQFDDPDNDQPVSIGRTYSGNLDYPGDVDTFILLLSRTETFHVRVESAVIDPLLTIDFEFSQEEEVFGDDNSGGGLFGLDAEMTYHSPEGGRLIIMVQSSGGSEIGGYFLTLDSPTQAHPTPMGPAPEPTPIASEFGQMTLYESENFPFTLQYPVEFEQIGEGSGGTCPPEAAACYFELFSGAFMAIVEEDLGLYGLEDLTLEEYLGFLISAIEESSDLQLESRDKFETAEGFGCEALRFTVPDDSVVAFRLVCLRDAVAFNALYVIPAESLAELEEVVYYSFGSLTME
jgi:S1-C subfamily serine protease